WALIWLAMLLIIEVIFWPLSDWLFRLSGVEDEYKRFHLSIAFSIPVGLAALGYPIWIGMMFGIRLLQPGTLWLISAIMGSVFWTSWGRKQLSSLLKYRKSAFKLLIMFALLYAFWWTIRVAGNEKFIKIGEHVMNLAFIQVMIRYPQIPPPNPFLAGFKIDFYYYFFALFLGILTSFSKLLPHIAYFLAGITWPVLIGLEVYALLRIWARKDFIPLLGLIFYCFLGNWAIFLQMAAEASWLPEEFLKQLSLNSTLKKEGLSFPPASELWWFFSTRIIPDKPFGYAITEFPLFSFTIGDLHPHVVSVPWTLLTLSFILVCEFKNFYQVVVGAFLIGLIAPLNFWTLIPLLALLGLKLSWNQFKRSVLQIMGTLGFAFLFFLPYHLQLRSPIVAYRFGLFPTLWWTWVVHWGPLLLPLFLGVIFLFQTQAKRKMVIIFTLIVTTIGSLLHFPLGTILTIGLIVLSVKVIKGDKEIALILTIGWLLTNLIPEFFYLEDWWGGRYNTIFKLYFDGWLLGTIAIPLLLERLPQWGKLASSLWMSTGLVYFFAILAFVLPNSSALTKGINFYWLPPEFFPPDRQPLLHQLAKYQNVAYIMEAETEYPIGPVLEGLIDFAQRKIVMPLWYPKRLTSVYKQFVVLEWFFRSNDEIERARILRDYPIDAIIIGHEERWLYGYDLDFNLSSLVTPGLSSGYVIAYRNFAPKISFELTAPLTFKGEPGEVKLKAFRITRGLDFADNPVLALFEIWEIVRGDTAEMSFYVHFLDSNGHLIAQGDHPLGLWDTRWKDPNNGHIYSVHWINLPLEAEISRIRIGVWCPNKGEYLYEITASHGHIGPNGSIELEFKN
ncbi:MAG: DUF2298 domain-containing protein, partial [Candidatus Bathyarchaeia archaeon]